MHPILARPGRVAGVCRAVAAARRSARRVARRAGRARLVGRGDRSPCRCRLCMVFSACRRGTRAAGLPVTAPNRSALSPPRCAAAFVSSALWLADRPRVAGRAPRLSAPGAISPAVSRGWPRRSSPFGFLLYLLAIAVSYMAVAFEASREAERRGLEAAGHGARSGAARAAGADRSALSLQQPAVDQRADHASIPPRRGGCACCSRIFFATRCRLARGSGSRSRVRSPSPTRFLAVEQVRFGERLQRRRDAAAPSVAWCRRCCCSRWSRTRSRTASPTSSRAARCRICARPAA